MADFVPSVAGYVGVIKIPEVYRASFTMIYCLITLGPVSVETRNY